MRKIVFLIVAIAIVLVISSTAQAASKTINHTKKMVKQVHHLVPPAIMAKWRLVNICEEGGRWDIRGPIYSGGLGITNVNWAAYGGQRLFGPAWKATPEQQVYIAIRIQRLNGAGDFVPDQNGCGQGW